MTLTLYGIRPCDTVKKARHWLDTRNIEYRFHDFRGDGLTPALLQSWLDRKGHEALINRRSTTWRGLSDTARAGLNREHALSLILANPTLIKRPVLTGPDLLLIGFDEKAYARLTTD